MAGPQTWGFEATPMPMTTDSPVDAGPSTGSERAAFLPQVRGQPGEAGAVHPGLQPGQLHEKAGLAGGDEALVADQYSDSADLRSQEGFLLY